jgi:hypothetical protein
VATQKSAVATGDGSAEKFVQGLLGGDMTTLLASDDATTRADVTPGTRTSTTTYTANDPLGDVRLERAQFLLAQEKANRGRIDELLKIVSQPSKPLFEADAAAAAVNTLVEAVKGQLMDAKGMNREEVPGFNAVKAFAEKNRGNFTSEQAGTWARQFADGPNRKGAFGSRDQANLQGMIAAWQAEVDNQPALKEQKEKVAAATRELNFRSGVVNQDSSNLSSALEQQQLTALSQLAGKQPSRTSNQTAADEENGNNA